jgi:hypothetical protein
MDYNLKPILFGKLFNEELIKKHLYDSADHLVIEMIASYGMAVGREVFDTCVWVGRFLQESPHQNKKQVYRKEVKMNLCHSMKAKDSNVIQALVDRFATGQPNHGKGTRKEPGWFYGFSKDVWQAYAVGVTYADLYIKPQQ